MVLLLVFWGFGALVRAFAGGPDLSAVRDLAAVRDPPLTAAAKALSLVGSGYVVFPLAAVAVGSAYLLRRRRAAVMVLVATFGAAIIENLDKLLVGRPRPPVHHLELVTSASFPSGHATQSTALYGTLLASALIGLPGQGRAAASARLLTALLTPLLVGAICFSRIYLGVHYPTDVAAGLLLGGMWSASVLRTLGGQPRNVPRSR